MYVYTNGVRLFFDVEGAKFVPDGSLMREKPSLLLLHGAYGFADHSTFKPIFSALADTAQLVYLDIRGAGRSDPGDPKLWRLEQWADDLVAFCEALGIDKPVVLGQSGGGFLAMAYASRHADHPGGLILASTQARFQPERSLAGFERFGGVEARTAAWNFLTDMTNETVLATYLRVCIPLYNTTPQDPNFWARVVRRPDLALAFHTWPHGEWHTFDLLGSLSRVCCPTLVLAGESDPITPIEDAEDIVAALPAELVRFERFKNCGHGVWRDNPERAFQVIREFIAAIAP